FAEVYTNERVVMRWKWSFNHYIRILRSGLADKNVASERTRKRLNKESRAGQSIAKMIVKYATGLD
ncbi:MAG TPA: hypothetical protein VJ728_01990, partial [Candidatus Binataceae bacterium]|nr:hypothetical protein [Candidatus Binataceae bacterium]